MRAAYAARRRRSSRRDAWACVKHPPLGEKRAAKRESADDLVERRFSTDMAWFAGITYVKTRQGWLYLTVVMDIWLRRIVG